MLFHCFKKDVVIAFWYKRHPLHKFCIFWHYVAIAYTCFCSSINITLQILYNIVCENSKMHFTAKYYYSNLWYKSYITSLKAVIAGKSVIFAGRDIERILHFIVYDKILQIYWQYWVRKFYSLPSLPHMTCLWFLMILMILIFLST